MYIFLSTLIKKVLGAKIFRDQIKMAYDTGAWAIVTESKIMEILKIHIVEIPNNRNSENPHRENPK